MPAHHSGLNPDDDAFDTLAVHAGEEPDELTGAVAPPIYQTSTYAQDGVGRPRGGYEYARTAEPDARAARAGGRGARGRHARDRLRERLGHDRGDRRAGRPGRRDRRRRRRVRRHVPLPRAGPPGARASTPGTSTSPAGPDVLWEALTERTRLVWFETPSNPLLKVVDIAAIARDGPPAGRRGRPAGRSSWSTTRSPRRRSSARSPSAPTSSSTRRRSTWAATRTRSSAWPSTARPADRRAAPLPPERDGRRARPARLLPRPARPADAATSAWNATPRTRRRSPRSSPGATTSSRSPTRGSMTARMPTRRRLVGAGRQMRAGGGMVSFLPKAGGRHGRTAARTGRRDLRNDPALHPGRVARRRRVAHRAAGGR